MRYNVVADSFRTETL